MQRRKFLTLLAGTAAAWPLAASAQLRERMRRIGVLEGVPEDSADATARRAVFLQALERLGWSEGRTARIDYRFGAGVTERYQTLAKELLALQPDVVLATTTPAVAALQREQRGANRVHRRLRPTGSGFTRVQPTGWQPLAC
jgi:putative ABC transport system substrate-binding protein